MSDVRFLSSVEVKLIDCMASDDMIVQAAQVSSKGENNPGTVPARLIEALMKGKHGSPFEHTAFKFFVKAPVFVSREWVRHRMAGINEMSGRYTQLLPEFYIPNGTRKMYNIGTKMKPQFVNYLTALEHGADAAEVSVQVKLQNQAREAWYEYQEMLDAGIANEVARMVLPVNIYSQWYWTVNSRSLMNFLSLRVESEDSLVKSYPQLEIQLGAEQVEKFFAEKMPITHEIFVKNGRVAP